MNTIKKQVLKHPLLYTVVIICIATISVHLFMASTETVDGDETYGKALTQNYRVYSPVLPATLTFAGEHVPLDHFYVLESLDREVLVNMYWQSNMVLIMKRAYRFFPVIEKILKEQGVPEDFKYLCVAESGLLNLTSSAKAQGYWQFMQATGAKYGLEVSSFVDERNNLELSTMAACKFLKDLYAKFGSWTSAASAYNCGENGLQKQIDLQNLGDYYHLQLYTETSRYLYRVLAFKLIMENPQKYGYFLRHRDLYPSIPYNISAVDTNIGSLHTFASQNEVSYKMLKTLNPWMIGLSLPNKNRKVYSIKMPVKVGNSWNAIRNKQTQSIELINSF